MTNTFLLALFLFFTLFALISTVPSTIIFNLRIWGICFLCGVSEGEWMYIIQIGPFCLMSLRDAQVKALEEDGIDDEGDY
jgi:hypothetical protein